MIERDELLRQAHQARTLATKAHRLAIGLGMGNARDAARLIAYAEELDSKARSLELQALASDSLSFPPTGLDVTHGAKQVQPRTGAAPRKQEGDPG